MLKQGSKLQIMVYTGHFLPEKILKSHCLMKDGLGGKIMKEFLGLRAKTYSYLIRRGYSF